jgi:hypothetical protein
MVFRLLEITKKRRGLAVLVWDDFLHQSPLSKPPNPSVMAGLSAKTYLC